MLKKISADVDELATMLSSLPSSSPSLQLEFVVMEVGWVSDAVGVAISTDTSGWDDDDGGEEYDDGTGCWKAWVDVTTTWWVSIAGVDLESAAGRRLV